MDMIWACIGWADRHIQQEQPFKKIKTDEKGAKEDVSVLLSDLMQIAGMLTPFMPETAANIQEAVKANTLTTGLFPRKD